MRQIKPSRANIKQILTYIKEMLEGRQYQKSITINLEQLNKDLIKTRAVVPTIQITKEAFEKMNKLVQGCIDEIGFHGIVEKEENTYTITDILVYPQTVTGATVTVDETELCEWQLAIPTETYNKIRMQGHSHVNMAATPSRTDHASYQKILQALPEDDFYLFLIMNKRGTIWMQFFDLKQNIVFENQDLKLVKIGVEEDDDWYDQQMALVKRPYDKFMQTKRSVTQDHYQKSFLDALYGRVDEQGEIR